MDQRLRAVRSDDGKPYTKNFLSIKAVKEGAVIDVDMAAAPNVRRGVEPGDAPYSFSRK